jgi:signal transduction histidine kinase
LWFPTVDGVAFVDPSTIEPDTNAPAVLIESVLLDGRPQSTNGLRFSALEQLTIPAGAESLEVRFVCLHLGAPEKCRFRYRLEGHETTWNNGVGNRGVAHYTRLPAGTYSFRVLAGNQDNVWNETGASLAVTVLPPFWQTWWFITLATVLGLGLVAAVATFVSTQKLQRQLAGLRQKEMLERERSRIARDLHDQLGANLTQVALLGELAEADKNLPGEIEEHARQISNTARETTRALDEIVWTVNPANDTLEGLINYICKYAQEYFALAGLKYRIEVPTALPAMRITPELRHHAFLAAKEAVNNVVKHANATSAWVRLGLEPGRFLLEIEDNGRGVPAGADRKGRSGLRNMRTRMEEIGGSFLIEPGSKGGTIVRLGGPLGLTATETEARC